MPTVLRCTTVYYGVLRCITVYLILFLRLLFLFHCLLFLFLCLSVLGNCESDTLLGNALSQVSQYGRRLRFATGWSIRDLRHLYFFIISSSFIFLHLFLFIYSSSFVFFHFIFFISSSHYIVTLLSGWSDSG